MAPPRNRRPPGRNLDKSGDSGRGGKAKKEGDEGLRWQHYVAFFLLGALIYWGSLHFYIAIRRTHPATLQKAKCLFDDGAPFFVPCKDRAQHNKDMLEYILSTAEDLSPEPLASASATYALSLAMRTRDTELGKEMVRWMLVPLARIECTRLIDVNDIDFQKTTPRMLCAEANYREGDVMDHSKAMEDLAVCYDLMILMCLYGSELHEGTMRATVEGQLEFRGMPVIPPRFAGHVENFYSKKEALPYAFLMDDLAKQRNKNEEDRMGMSFLAVELEKSLTAMRRCNPPANITWMEYHSRAVFKRALYENSEDECGWATAEDSFWEKVKLAYYDANFRFRRMLGKI